MAPPIYYRRHTALSQCSPVYPDASRGTRRDAAYMYATIATETQIKQHSTCTLFRHISGL